MSKFEFGIVKFFNENKQFGFIRVTNRGTPTGEELFFHFNSGYFLVEGDYEPEFKLQTGMTHGLVKRLRTPLRGETLVFTRGRNAQGDKASQWAYSDQFDEIADRIANRPMYRVYRKATNDFYVDKAKQRTEGVIWEGQNIYELSAKFPKQERFGRVTDSLGFGSAEDGYMTSASWIERKLPDGTWRTVDSSDDPRVLVCCIPRSIYRQHGSTLDQGRCFHGNRR